MQLIKLSVLLNLLITIQFSLAEEKTFTNLAPLADITGPGKNTRAVADGIKLQHGKGEWVGKSPNTWYGSISYPTLSLKWQKLHKVNKIVLYDRPEENNHMAACIIKFSDGTKEHIFAVPNKGSAKTITFAPKLINELQIHVVDGVGSNIGLSEVEVYYNPSATPAKKKEKTRHDFVSYVDPTIETGRGRWFFCTPGSRPFGMVAASAYTRNKNQGGGGYNYNSTEILGFANIHAWIMSGVNIMPVTGTVNPNLGEKGWKSSFSHETEIIEPGYHKLYLERYKTQVEYTSTDRVAFYRMKYTDAAKANLLLQLGGFVGAASYVGGKAKLVSETQIEGSHGMTDRLWGGPKLTRVFFVMEFDRPIKQMNGWKGATEQVQNIKTFHTPIQKGRIPKGYYQQVQKFLFKNLPEEQAGVALAYDVAAGDEVKVRIGISYTSIENARNNLKQECSHWDFDKVRTESRQIWNNWLGKIAVKGGPLETRIKFYTDLWHVLLGRHKIDDYNGDWPSYMGADGPKGYPELEVKSVPKNGDGKPTFHMYNSDALWLTMWNLNVLWGLGWPELMDEFSASMMEYARHGGLLPRGPCAGGYSNIMVGNPATSLITATWQKNLLTKTNASEAYRMMKKSQQARSGDGRNVGIEIQTSFEYWALAQMAEEMGLKSDAAAYRKEINDWQKFYSDKHKLLMAPGNNDPLNGRGWIEANSWQATFGLAHDLPGLAKMMGGNNVLTSKLNHAFEMASPQDFIGGYSKGYVSYANQPGCSNAHVFNHVGKPWLSQYWVRQVSKQAYGGTNPNVGYGGHDEDQGQMGGVSALMKIGLFSLRGNCSKEPIYEITTPEFDEVRIQLAPNYYSGKTFTIKAYNNSAKNIYIQRAKFNDKVLKNSWLYHKDFAKGGKLELWLGPEANKSWGITAPP